MIKSIIMKEIKILDLILKLKNTEFDFLIPLLSFIHDNNQLPDNYSELIKEIPLYNYNRNIEDHFLIFDILLLLKNFDTKKSLLPLFKIMTINNYDNLFYFNMDSSFKNAFLSLVIKENKLEFIQKILNDEKFNDELGNLFYSCYYLKIPAKLKHHILNKFFKLNKNLNEFNLKQINKLKNCSQNFLILNYFLFYKKFPNILDYLFYEKTLLLERHRYQPEIIMSIESEYESIVFNFNLQNF